MLIRHCRTLWWRHHFAHENFDISQAGRCIGPYGVCIKNYLMFFGLRATYCHHIWPYFSFSVSINTHVSIQIIRSVAYRLCEKLVIQSIHVTKLQLFAILNNIQLKSKYLYLKSINLHFPHVWWAEKERTDAVREWKKYRIFSRSSWCCQNDLLFCQFIHFKWHSITLAVILKSHNHCNKYNQLVFYLWNGKKNAWNHIRESKEKSRAGENAKLRS